MSADDLTPTGLLIGFAIFAILVALVAIAWAALSWRQRRPAAVTGDQHDLVIDLTYLERAIKADEEAAARRNEQDKPLLSRSPWTGPDHRHRLPTDER